MEGIIEKALKEDLPDILNLQKKAFEKVAMEENIVEMFQKSKIKIASAMNKIFQ